MDDLADSAKTNPISKGVPVPLCGNSGQAGGYKMLAKLGKTGKDGACNGMFFERKKRCS
jgi:hypothetical protein